MNSWGRNNTRDMTEMRILAFVATVLTFFFVLTGLSWSQTAPFAAAYGDRYESYIPTSACTPNYACSKSFVINSIGANVLVDNLSCQIVAKAVLQIFQFGQSVGPAGTLTKKFLFNANAPWVFNGTFYVTTLTMNPGMVIVPNRYPTIYVAAPLNNLDTAIQTVDCKLSGQILPNR